MVLGGEKKLCPLSELKPVAIGHYPEVSVKTLYPMYCDRPEVRDYLPSKLAKGRSLDKTYFFNILNTFVHDELQKILSHAHEQRNSIADQQQRSEAIMLSEQMAEDLFKFPWISVSENSVLLTLLFLEIARQDCPPPQSLCQNCAQSCKAQEVRALVAAQAARCRPLRWLQKERIQPDHRKYNRTQCLQR